MAGRMGAEQVTTLNLEVVEADAERDLLLVEGRGPRPRGGVVIVRDAVKAAGREVLMASVNVQDARRRRRGTVELDDDVFGIEPNVPVMHQVVTAQLPPAGRARRAPRPAPRCAAVAPSRAARRAPAAPARARSGRRTGPAAASPSARSPAATPSAPRRR